MDAETHRFFDRWVVVPFSVLRQLPDGDGAFAALAMGFGLYERFIDSKIHNRGDKPCPERRYEEAAKDFEDRVKAEDFKSFWDMYRVGIQHYFHPKHFTKSNDNTRWGWDISANENYNAFPVILNPEPDLFIIAIDPWAFVEHILKRWYEYPELMNELSATTLGEIQQPDEIPRPAPLDTSRNSYQSAGKHAVTLAQLPGTGIYPTKMW